MHRLRVTGHAHGAHGHAQHAQTATRATKCNRSFARAHRQRSSPRPPLRTSPTAPAGARGVGPLEGQDRSQTRRPSRKRATQRAKEEAVNEAHRVEHGSVRMRERLGQWPGAGSTRNGRRKRATLGATHLLLAIKDRCHARGGAPRAPTAKMAKPSLTPATTPVSMRKVK